MPPHGHDPQASTPAAYFDALYGASDDPWHFETSDYEARKYAATLAALPRPRYRSALEIGSVRTQCHWAKIGLSEAKSGEW